MMIEFGNDEVYYHLYAQYPDWSHFDHPPMVGFMMQLFSFNLLFDSELAMRMSSIVLGSFNILLIFKIGSALKNERTGWFAALLYTASVYAFVICGIFILPDTPQSFFWLLTLLFFIKTFQKDQDEKKQKYTMLWAGFFCGMAFLSKYTSLFLWSGAGIFILGWKREWLKRKELYFSVLLTILGMVPVLVWNLQNDFISFTFHSERVTYQQTIRPDYFVTELAGELLYNNPLVVILTILAVVACFRKKISANKELMRLLLCIALPFIVTFWVVSWQRATLPHWSAPAFITLIPLTAAWLDEKTDRHKKFNGWITSAVGLLAIVLVVGFGQIQYGWFTLDRHQEYDKMGKDDFSLDMYGWKQLNEEFQKVRQEKIANGKMRVTDPLMANNWFPAANLEYYVARPSKISMLAIGPLEKIHKYAWINEKRGGFSEGMNGWWITSSRDFVDPISRYSDYFTEIGPADTIAIVRNRQHVMNYYVYPMKNMKKIPEKIF
ncbi:MAG: glycosyltransferase family 39 protein [Bacteroidales bacterium]|nr:glycosyltransferase family 39 protein [Bacteroidales bacterium]